MFHLTIFGQSVNFAPVFPSKNLLGAPKRAQNLSKTLAASGRFWLTLADSGRLWMTFDDSG